MNGNQGFKIQPGITDIPSIGLMRGIASVMVCFFHLAHENPRLPAESIVKQLGTWGWTGVQIFFIISGFVIPYSMYVKNYSTRQIAVFLKKRIIRIEPPYLVSILLVLLLSYLSTLLPTYGGAPLTISWINVASHMAYLNVFTGEKWLQDVYWTLAIEFQYYLLISLAYGLIASKNIYYRLVFYILFITALNLGFLGKDFIFSYTAYFMLGILLFQYFCNIIGNREYWILLAISMATLFYFEGAVLTFLSVATLLMIAFVKKVPPFLQFLGTISFSLYLVHIPIGGRLNNLAGIFIENVNLRELMVFAAFGCCLLAAFIFYVLVEKKFKNLAASIAYKK